MVLSADADDERGALHHVGDRSTGRLVPLSSHAGAEGAALVGASVELVTYEGSWGSPIRILWR